MNEVTLQLPEKLYNHLEILAEKEAVSLDKYIVELLFRQISESYEVRSVPPEEVAEQKTAFDDLLRKWGRITESEADEILENREQDEPDPDLTPEVITRLKARIANGRGSGINARPPSRHEYPNC